ncbi:MAG: hypothetical protein EXR28_13540 [Betaproteobacteria bacterium]|nr:hypothetical protein [Betaproteobacteria bacterium]
MKLQTLSHSSQTGWSSEPDRSLDSDQTLVLLFGAPGLADSPANLGRVMEIYPRGITAVLPESVVVTGGLAGDGDRFVRTWVLNGRPMQAAIATCIIRP